MPAPLTKTKRHEMFLAYTARSSLAHVQRSCKVDFRTAQRYRSLDDWDGQRRVLDQKLVEAAVGTVADMRNEYLRIIRGMVSDFAERVAEGKVKIENPKDLVAIIGVEQLLRGEATARVDTGPKSGGRLISEMTDEEVLESLTEQPVETASLSKRIANAERRQVTLKRAAKKRRSASLN